MAGRRVASSVRCAHDRMDFARCSLAVHHERAFVRRAFWDLALARPVQRLRPISMGGGWLRAWRRTLVGLTSPLSAPHLLGLQYCLRAQRNISAVLRISNSVVVRLIGRNGNNWRPVIGEGHRMDLPSMGSQCAATTRSDTPISLFSTPVGMKGRMSLGAHPDARHHL